MENLNHLLVGLRSQIDTIDKELICLLWRRLEIVQEVGAIKKDIWAEPLQVERWNTVIGNLCNQARDQWINEELVKNIWSIIHEEALRIEK